VAPSGRVYLFHGPDAFSAREALRALRQELAVDATNVVRLYGGQDLTLAEVAAACQTASFFAEPRLVVIEQLSAMFGARRRSRRPARQRGPQPEPAASDGLAEVLAHLPPTTTVVILEDQVSASFMESLKGLAEVRAFPILRAEEVRRWAAERAKSLGASISPQALERLCELVDGYHLGELAHEIDKLIAYADGRRIEASDVEAVGSGAIEHQNWDLTDAVVAGRADRALRVLQEMDAKQHPPQLLHTMIIRQFRLVILAQDLLRQGFSTPQIGERLGTAGFPLRKVIDQASRYPADRLEAAYRRLLESDAAVKTGVLDVETALECLIVDLASIAAGGRSRPAGALPPARRFGR
jgi:DNA polymerase-3 subunit delta